MLFVVLLWSFALHVQCRLEDSNSYKKVMFSSESLGRRFCSLRKVEIDLFKLIQPWGSDTSNDISTRARGSVMGCEQWYAVSLLSHCMPVESALKYSIQRILGSGLNGITLGLQYDGNPGPVAKVVILDTSSKNIHISDELSGGVVRPAKFFGEYTRHRRLYDAYHDLSFSEPDTFKGLSFELFDIYNITNYTVINKSSGNHNEKEQQIDVAFYIAERISSNYAPMSWGNINKNDIQLYKVYLEQLLKGLVQLFNIFRFVHGDMHLGNVRYDPDSNKLAIFDFDRGIFVKKYSEYTQYALFLRDCFMPLAFLMTYYSFITIQEKIALSNLYCEVTNKFLKMVRPLKLLSESQRSEFNNYKKIYLQKIPSEKDYDKIITEKEAVYTKLDTLFWKYTKSR